MINNDNVGPKNRVVGCSGDLPLITLYEISALVEENHSQGVSSFLAFHNQLSDRLNIGLRKESHTTCSNIYMFMLIWDFK